MRQLLSSPRRRRLVVIGLVLPCLLVSIPAFIAYWGQRQLADSMQWVTHTLQVERKLERLLTVVVSAESGHRGYLMTGRADFLESTHMAVGEIPAIQATLRTLLQDNPLQQAALARLNERVKEKLAFMAESEAIYERGDTAGAMALISTGRGNQLMKAIKAQLSVMQKEEDRLLSLRQQSLTQMAGLSTVLLSALVAVSLLLAGTIFVMLRRLARSEAIVHMCAWSRTIDYGGKWVTFEEYLLRRFGVNTSHGISPDEAAKVIADYERPGEPPLS